MLRVVDRSPSVRVIGLNRAAKRNAIGVELSLALEGELLRLRDDPAVRVLVFHGIGDHFSAGMDMKDFFDSSARAPQLLRSARNATDHWRVQLLRELPQRVICAVRGYCLGGALPLLAAADMVIANREARIGLPEINFGLVPGAQIVKSVAQMTSLRGVAYLALTGRPINAEQALQWGIVTEIVEGNPLDRALALADAYKY
jgi:enoyl-CoA hydratase/carnithine racemase